MPPVKRGAARPTAQSRRAATAPAQQRRTAAARPSKVEDDATPFDAAGQADDDEELDEEDLPEVVDLSEVQAASYEVIPRGTYEGYIDSVEYGLSVSSNQPMLTWMLKFDYPPEGEEGSKERTLRFYTTLGGDGAGRTKATLARLDPELDLSTLVPGDMDEHFSGVEVKIRVTVRPDREDKKLKRNNVADIFPLEDLEDDE